MMHINSSDNTLFPELRRVMRTVAALDGAQLYGKSISDTIESERAAMIRYWHIFPSGLEGLVPGLREALDSVYVNLYRAAIKGREPLGRTAAWRSYALAVVNAFISARNGPFGNRISSLAAARLSWFLNGTDDHGFLPFATVSYLSDLHELVTSASVGISEVRLRIMHIFTLRISQRQSILSFEPMPICVGS